MAQLMNGESEDTPYTMLQFSLLKPTELAHAGPRLGKLLCKGRSTIPTPHYVAPTSRGVVPHVTPDIMQNHTKISAVYIGLEDFIEKSPEHAPIFQIPDNEVSALQDYTGLPRRILSILGPRRVPRTPCPALNTNSSVVVSTSVGFQNLQVEDYNDAAQSLKPDCVTSAVDLVDADKISKKRLEKSVDRTHGWMRDTIGARAESEAITSDLLASVPPVEAEQQSFYLSDLANEFADNLSGLCVYTPETVSVIPQALSTVPRLCVNSPPTPPAVLRAVSLGVDLITIPFVTTTSEQGIAMSFRFPAPEGISNEPLGSDMWSTSHATDLSPLSSGCECYACTHHHRAYVHHLLQAKEMLAWTLLQIHNFFVMDSFFHQVRQSIDDGSFEANTGAFSKAYQSEMPIPTGQGPRVRGYQMKSAGGESRKNPKVYGRLDDQLERLAESQSGVATPEGPSAEIENHGLAEKAPRIN